MTYPVVFDPNAIVFYTNPFARYIDSVCGYLFVVHHICFRMPTSMFTFVTWYRNYENFEAHNEQYNA